MAGAMRLIVAGAILFCAVVALATEADSLRGALEALDRRQRALQQRPASQGARFHYQTQQLEQQDDDDVEFLPLEPGQPEDIGYGYQRGGGHGQKHETHSMTPQQVERILQEYIQGDEDDDSRGEDERWTSFRERDPEPSSEVKRTPPASMFRERQRQDKRSAAPNDERYMQLLAALWDKYQREMEAQQEGNDESPDKRQDGYGYGYDFYNSPMGWGDGHFNGYKRSGAAENDPWFPAFELVPRERQSQSKRFPVAKRSSGAAPMHHKQQGEKVAKDLAEIFEDKKKTNNSNNSSTEAPTTVTTGTPHPAMHKKSVDWSQYFGIDRRRKKSATPAEGSTEEESAEEAAQRENEQRLMDQYYHTLALATTVKRKRSGGSTSSVQSDEPASLEGMDQKLKAMEDLIVDEAVKYTGAHQGTADPQEIQSVKEQVLSRLSAAYSLEKMRQALDEFRSSLGHEDQEQDTGRDEKRAQPLDCPELRALAASCRRVQPAFVEPCTWHHACEACSGDGEGGQCDAGFLQAASQVCEGHTTCLRGARRLLTVISRTDSGPARCDICVRRFLESRRR